MSDQSRLDQAAYLGAFDATLAANARIASLEDENERLTRERDSFRKLLTDVRNLLVEDEDSGYIIEDIDLRWAKIENNEEASDD